MSVIIEKTFPELSKLINNLKNQNKDVTNFKTNIIDNLETWLKKYPQDEKKSPQLSNDSIMHKAISN